MIQEFKESSSQITSITFQNSDPEDQRGSDFVFMATTYDGNVWVYDLRLAEGLVKKISVPDVSPWCLSVSFLLFIPKMTSSKRNILDVDHSHSYN